MYMGVKPCVRYFDMPARAQMCRMALNIGGIEFDDLRAGKDFNWEESKEDMSSFAWKDSFGFMPVLTRGDFSLC
jgi:hypothetical protein